VASGAALSLEYDSTIGGNSPQPEAPGGVTISSGGNLAGNGILSGTLAVNSGGKVTPGIGGANAVLTVPNIDLSSGVVLQSTLGNTNSSDVLKVSTASTGLILNGGLVSLIPVGTTNPAGQTYALIDYNTGYTGDYHSLLVNNQTGFDDTTLTDDTANHLIKAVVGTVVTDRTWVRESSFGNWNSDAPPGPNESANWAKTADNTTPATAANGVGAKATFPAISPITSNAIPSETVFISDVNKTLGTLVLDNPNSFTFTPGLAGLRLAMQTYTGNALIDVKQGTHTFNTGLTIASPTDINLANNTTLTLTTSTTNPGANGSNPVSINTAGNSIMSITSLANPGGLTKTGSGSLIVSSTVTGVGDTNINDGTLQLKDNNAGLGDTSTINIGATGTWDMNTQAATVPTGGAQPTAVNDTVGALAGSGKLDHHGTVTIGGSNAAPVTFSGTLDNSGGNTAATVRTFTKNGSGTQIYNGHVLNGASFLLGTLNAGTVLLNNAASADSLITTGTASVNSTATIGGTGVLNTSLTINVGTTTAAGGTLSPGNSTLTLPNRIGTFTVASGKNGDIWFLDDCGYRFFQFQCRSQHHGRQCRCQRLARRDRRDFDHRN